MRHKNANRKFGRPTKQRQALLSSLAASLILREKMTTTLPKAKEIRPYVEKLVTRAKNPTLANRRIIAARLATNDENVSKKLLDTIAPKYQDRAGGYLRITRVGVRESDAAPQAVIEFV